MVVHIILMQSSNRNCLIGGSERKQEQSQAATCHFKIDFSIEICPNTEFYMLKFVTVSLEELSSAAVKFDV